MPSSVEAVRAEALFASILQSSDEPAADEVRVAVISTLRRLGLRGCATRVAGEFGEHPETAVNRMVWALSVVRTVYPTPAEPARPAQPAKPVGAQPAAQRAPRPLALAG
jgi:hypothetical protein